MTTSNTAYTAKYTVAIALSMALITGCNSGGGTGETNTGNVQSEDVALVADDSPSTECSLDQKKQWIDANMRDDYLFYDQVPVVNLDDFDSEESLLDALRVLPTDVFSYITDRERSDRYLEQGKAYGIGFSWRNDDAGLAKISIVQTDSPIGRAGVTRGDIIESINGVNWENISSEEFSSLTSKPSLWAFIDATDDTRFEVTLEKAEYDFNAVLHYQTTTDAEYEGVIGYLALDQFSPTASEELDVVMDFFTERNITDLVLDLRYNRSGYDTVGKKLASQLAGPSTDGALFAKYRFNDKYSEKNTDLYLENEFKSLGLNRLTVLVTETTETVSELVINGLRPYMPVTLFGNTTAGRAYLSSNRDYCDKRLNIPVLESFNADDVSVAGGLAPNCAAVDDLDSDFGLNSETGQTEGMLRSALDFLVYGTCNAPTNIASQRSLLELGLGKQEIAPIGTADIR